jgi:hypothetical protein
MFRKSAFWLLLLVVIFPLTAAANTKPEAPFANEDVIKLTKLQLGDEVIVAKIKQAAEVSFDLTTDGLVKLKQSAVSGPVISAMLERSTPKKQAASAVIADAGGSYGDGVRVIAGGEEVRLPSNRGDLSTTGMWPVVFTFLDYPGRFARTRVKEPRPTLVVQSEHDPKSYYYLARLDVNDEDENNRSLKIEQKMSGFTATTRVIPAGRWHVEYDASEASPGVWHLVPRRDLEPGEYGVVVPGGILYEFGID